MLSFYFTVVRQNRDFRDWEEFRLSSRDNDGVLPIGRPSFDKDKWFGEGGILAFDIETTDDDVQTLIYHPNARKLKQWFSAAAPAAADFIVFAAYMGHIHTTGMKAFTKWPEYKIKEAVEDVVSVVYRGGSAIKIATEGGRVLHEHLQHLLHPGVYAEEGFYDEDAKLRYRGSLHKRDLYYGPCPPKLWPGRLAYGK